MDAAFAIAQVRAATLTVRQGVWAGKPRLGSMRWWRTEPPRCQRRALVLDVASPPAMQVAIAMDVGAAGSRTEQGVWRDIVVDGQWHFYEWNLDLLSDWTQWKSASGAVLNNSTGVFPTSGQVTLDSILFKGGDFSAEFLLDSVMVNSAGSLAVMDYVPEPVGLGIWAGFSAVLAARRRR